LPQGPFEAGCKGRKPFLIRQIFFENSLDFFHSPYKLSFFVFKAYHLISLLSFNELSVTFRLQRGANVEVICHPNKSFCNLLFVSFTKGFVMAGYSFHIFLKL
jgi:hypothetical protein